MHIQHKCTVKVHNMVCNNMHCVSVLTMGGTAVAAAAVAAAVAGVASN